jgi:peptide/nickel transport system substrate-binding protein
MATYNQSNFAETMLTASLSRRAFLRRSALLAVSLPAISALLAACADAEPEPPAVPDVDETPVPDDDEVEEVTPEPDERRGGTVRVGVPGTADNFDPHLQVTFESIWPNGMMYSGLVRIDSELEVVPDLALSWEANEEVDHWTFTLREGVLFHNGREMTAEDVVDSFNRIRDPDVASQFAEQLDMLDRAEATADDTVDFFLTVPYSDFPAHLGNYFARIVPMEEADNLRTAPVGTGPYVLHSHRPGERTILRRFEQYFDPENQGFLDEIHYVMMAEETARITALTGRFIEVVPEVSAALVRVLKDAPGVEVGEIVTGSYNPTVMVYDEPPFDDLRVRTALKLCIDRSGFMAAVVRGKGEEAADQPIPPIDPMYGDIPIPQQDIERARELMAEAGYADGFELLLHTTAGRAGMLESALTVQEMGKAAGFEIRVRNHPVDAYWADIWMNVPFFVSNWSGRPTADNVLSLVYVSGAQWNESRWTNEQFDDLVFAAREEIDPDQRREILREAQQLLSNEGPVIIPYFRTDIGAWSSRLRDYELHPLRWIELHRAWLADN